MYDDMTHWLQARQERRLKAQNKKPSWGKKSSLRAAASLVAPREVFNKLEKATGVDIDGDGKVRPHTHTTHTHTHTHTHCGARSTLAIASGRRVFLTCS
jgi:hypothetical protein